MKKPTKSIITSSLLAIAFGALSVGTTFALFTSEASTAIDVKAGVIDLKAPVTVSSAWELGGTSMTGSGFAWANSIGGSITKDDSNVIHLNKLAPGDGALFALTPDNSGTNVKTKARLVVTLEGELAGALNVEVKAGEDMVIGFNGAHTGYTPWQEVAVESNPTAFTVKVEFPDHDNGEIRFGSENQDNQYQDKEATLVIGYEAVQGNAQTDDMLQIINNTLMTKAYQGSANKTMFDALEDLTADQKTAIEERGYVWSVEEDQFYNFTATPTAPHKFFKMYSAMPEEQTYSIYAGSEWNTATVNLTGVGFDAGSASGVAVVNYVGAAEARSNVIRTNSSQTAVNVDAAQDTISHYGTAGSLNINAIAGNSYHEFGKAIFAEIKTGRMALEKGAEVDQIHLAVTGTGTEAHFNDIVIAKDSTVDMPDFSRDPVSIPEEGRLVVALQGSTSTTANKDYVWLTAVGVYEQVTVSESKTEAGNTYAANTTDTVKQEAAQQIANNITATVNDNDYTLTATTTDGGQTWTYALESETPAVEPITEAVTVAVVQDVATVSVAEEAKATTTENGISETQKEHAKQEAVEEAIIDEIEDDEDNVARIGTVGYKTFSAAWSAGSGKTIVLLKNVALSALQINDAYTIDLNGKTMTLHGHPQTNNAGIFIHGDVTLNKNGSLVIRNGSLNLTGSNVSNYGIYCYGTLTMDNVNISSSCNEAIHVEGHSYGNNNTITLNRVTLNATQNALQVNGYKDYWGSAVTVPTINISNSSITCGTGSTHNAFALNGANGVVTNSTFTSEHNKAIFVYSNGTASGIVPSLSLSGEVTCNASGSYNKFATNGTVNVSITSGTYNFNPTSYVDADSYCVVDNGNGTWSVLKMTYKISADGKVYKNNELQEYTYSALFGLIENSPMAGLAQEGEVIYFTNGRYVLGGHYFTQPGVILIGQSRDEVIVSGHDSDNVFTSEGDLTIMNMTLESNASYAITPDVKNTAYSKALGEWDSTYVIKNVTFSNTSGALYTGYNEYAYGVNVPSKGNVLIENCLFQYLGCAVCGVRDLQGSKTTIKNCTFVDTKEAIGYVAADVLEATVNEWLNNNTGLLVYDNLYGDVNANDYSKNYLRNRLEAYYGVCHNYVTAY